MSINPNAVVMLVNTPMEALDGVYRVQVREGNVTDLKRLDDIVDNRKDFIIEGGELVQGHYVSELLVTRNFLRLHLAENFVTSKVIYRSGMSVFLYTSITEYGEYISFFHADGVTEARVKLQNPFVPTNYFVGEDILVIPQLYCSYTGKATVAKSSADGYISFFFAGGKGFQNCGRTKIVRLSKSLLTGTYTINNVTENGIEFAEPISMMTTLPDTNISNVGYLFIKNATGNNYRVHYITENLGYSTLIANCTFLCPSPKFLLEKVSGFTPHFFQIRKIYHAVGGKIITNHSFEVNIDGRLNDLDKKAILFFNFDIGNLWFMRPSNIEMQRQEQRQPA